MKSALLTLSFICLSLFGYSQIVISEIMYNPPESGQDSLEYIEITNAGMTAVDISGYHFLQGVEDTVAMGTMLPAGAAYVFSESSVALMTVLSVASDQWTDGALSNGGETIEIADASGNSLDIVAFSDQGGWPDFMDGTDGQGASIELCDLGSDNNDAASWSVSGTDTGVEINGNNISGTPGAANTAVCMLVPDHMVEATANNVFSPADITINVGEVVGWTNVGGGNHNVNGSLASYPNNPEGFDNGAPSTANWTFNELFATVGVYDYQSDPAVAMGMVGTVTVIDPNAPTFPSYDIGLINTIDADGVADSVGVDCRISGIVHGINFRPAGLTFTLIDADGDGIGLFSGSENFGYTVVEGDVI
jgi:plastocyanin